MKLYRFPRLGKVEELQAGEEPRPQPGPGQVLVRVKAVALNFRDLLIAWDQYPAGALKPDVIPLSDGAGEVVAVGAGVTRVKTGDRVTANFLQRWIAGPLRQDYLGSDLGGSLDGLLAEYVVLPQDGLVRLPAYLSFEEAGSLTCAALTAWSSLTVGAPLEPGHTVLVQGTGGVSIFALQFAKAFGARVIALTSSAAKGERLKSLGADQVINYKENPNWDASVRQLTDGLGVDRVVEVAGPATMGTSVNSLAVSGRIALVGFVGGAGGNFNPLQMLGRGIAIDAISVGNRDQYDAMLKAMAAHRIRPVIDRVYEFDQARDAYKRLEAREHIGKVVIRL
ncbi:MAG TPA: NAD(P)-dependent alcohol dehydrogenase [Steroidobacteraceae bacterium]|nr:NAD(P)-dependent alcohol dehydrogenase [Steroidobacteraceae bacterium]